MKLKLLLILLIIIYSNLCLSVELPATKASKFITAVYNKDWKVASQYISPENKNRINKTFFAKKNLDINSANFNKAIFTQALVIQSSMNTNHLSYSNIQYIGEIQEDKNLIHIIHKVEYEMKDLTSIFKYVTTSLYKQNNNWYILLPFEIQEILISSKECNCKK